MALTITGVPDCRASLGPSQELRAYQLAPGTSDYPTGGYPITAAQVGLSWLYGAWIINKNGTTYTYYPEFISAIGAFNGANGPQPVQTIYLKINEILASGAIYVFEEVAALTNLSGYYFVAEFLGY